MQRKNIRHSYVVDILKIGEGKKFYKKTRRKKGLDAKITKKRLGTMLSYDWGKMLLAILSFILVWAIVFSSSAARKLS